MRSAMKEQRQRDKRFWKNQHAARQDQRPRELECEWDPIGSRGCHVFRTIVDDGSKEQSNSDGQLVGADDGTADPLWRRL